ncbi:polymorphic toxin-type HINT domain-containing protein [Spartinivicinus poritis]|uniref:Polymorphic toxin-type HINT domain-containing protein n=1 Tax=Spartinivicinus poritis TaxID=2994640 RepID=A0ABT5UCM9_9GAMM|nr:polymorphic toxin-type HINT domain-containing protein [Spartinivicinus sp. A2-2]MDE1464139.1 polymorphic toxin-type HINT domain-containing protein [Spartinivicinus sp. A2-2]
MEKTPSTKIRKRLSFKAGAFALLSLLSTSLFANNSDDLAVELTVKPLDLSRTPTREELMQAGQLGGQLVPTSPLNFNPENKDQPSRSRRRKRSLDPDDEVRAMFSDFGAAIQAWNRHDYKEAYQLFDQYQERYPNSPWAGEAVLHMGCEARYNGRYKEAASHFTQLISQYRSQDYVGARWLGDKALSRLAVLKVLENNIEDAIKLFGELKQTSVDWRIRTYAANWIQRLSRQQSERLALLDCGTRALAHLLEKDGKNTAAKEVLAIKPADLKGHSVAELTDLAKKHGYDVSARALSIDDLSRIPLPAVVQIDRSGNSAGHYWILETVTDTEVTLYDPQMNRRFFQSLTEFDSEWAGNTLVFGGNNLPGEALSEELMASTFGGCCGVPRPEDGPGEPEDEEPEEPKECPEGAPIWKVDMVSMNLFMKDVPLWYKPAIGPQVRIQLSYNSQTSVSKNELFGNKWTFNYGSYIMIDPGKSPTVVMPDGAQHTYVPQADGSYAPPYNVFNTLRKISDHHFELELPGGLTYEYNLPVSTDSMQTFMVGVKDKYGQQLTFNYNDDVKLTTITDALGQVTNLTYNELGLVTQITDPFGRKAAFEYDSSKNLVKLTDMGGYWTKVGYDEFQAEDKPKDKYVSSVENPLGKWTFYVEAADGINNGSNAYNPPGTAMWDNYRITITDPNGNKEEYYYDGYHGKGWHVAPNNYVEYQDANVNNYKTAAKTEYEYYKRSNNQGRIKKITYPDGRVIDYQYDEQTGLRKARTENGQAKTFQKNSQGNVTQQTNALGQTVKYEYAANGKDVTKVETPQGTVEFQYNQHRNPTLIKDVLGRETQFTYNNYGQVTYMEVAGKQKWEYTYNEKHQRTTVTFNGQVVKQYTYDAIGRIKTETDETGLTKTYAYNGLNSTTTVTYPDGKQTTTTYGQCPRMVTSETDRGGRKYQYEYDPAKQLTKIISPEGSFTRFEYDANGNLITLIDANHNKTRFEFNNADQLTAKIFADDSRVNYSYEQGQIKTRTDARGVVTTYHYDDKKRLSKITYSDSTPEVSYTYNDQGQVASITDGVGTHQFTYTADGKVASFDGPWEDDTIEYRYDTVGGLHQIIPSKGQTIKQYYDGMGRLEVIKAGNREFTYFYNGANPTPTSLLFNSRLQTQYKYNSLSRLSRISHHAPTNPTITEHKFTYNDQDLIDQVEYEPLTESSIQEDKLTQNQFNNLNQLINQAGYKNNSPVYDKAGNLISGLTVDGHAFTASYDAENRLTEISYTDNQGKNHKREYKYDYSNYLAEILHYENSNLVKTTRIIRHDKLALQERNASNEITREYVWGLDDGGGIGGLLSLTQNGQHYYYLYDGQGNVVGVVDDNDQVVAAYEYEPFGQLISKKGTLEQPFGFSTKRYDEGTGLIYYGYRYYAPHLSIWTTRDPLGEAGGINLYQFVESDPVNLIDPLGLAPGEKFQTQIAAERDMYDWMTWMLLPTLVGLGETPDYFVTGPYQTEDGCWTYDFDINWSKDWDDILIGITPIGKLKYLKHLKKQGKSNKPPVKSKDPEKKKCFIAGTLVHTTDGLKPIEDIKVGDLVASKDEKTRATGWKPVEAIYRNPKHDVTYLTVLNEGGKEETLGTTSEHPFWTSNNAWTEAGQLQLGDKILTKGGDTVTVTSILPDTKQYMTYNFEVSDYHTYFVGQDGVWVHNGKGPKKCKNGSGSEDKKDDTGENKDPKKNPKWTPHGYKHSAPKNRKWSDIVKDTKSGPAKYKQGTDIESLEKDAWKTGTDVTNGKPWKVKEYDQPIGASEGKESRWIRIEYSGETIHGHPISKKEYQKLLK